MVSLNGFRIQKHQIQIFFGHASLSHECAFFDDSHFRILMFLMEQKSRETFVVFIRLEETLNVQFGTKKGQC